MGRWCTRFRLLGEQCCADHESVAAVVGLGVVETGSFEAGWRWLVEWIVEKIERAYARTNSMPTTLGSRELRRVGGMGLMKASLVVGRRANVWRDAAEC